MNDVEHIMQRYLLGELPAAEQEAWEQRYFSDPEVFAQALAVETALVDDYVRQRLPPGVRQQFEQHYLAHPERHERVEFAAALAHQLDHLASAEVGPQRVDETGWWRAWRNWWSSLSLMPQISMAVASLLFVIGGWWWFNANEPLRQEVARTPAAPVSDEQRARESEADDARGGTPSAAESETPVAQERKQAAESSADRQGLRAQLEQGSTSKSSSSPPLQRRERPARTFVSLLLTPGGMRGTDSEASASLVIPRGTNQVRLQLNLADTDYPSYHAVLQLVGGAEIFSRRNLTPRASRSGTRFVFTVPARRLVPGDYILTLSGVNRDGEVDDLSKSLFRVDTP